MTTKNQYPKTTIREWSARNFFLART